MRGSILRSIGWIAACACCLFAFPLFAQQAAGASHGASRIASQSTDRSASPTAAMEQEFQAAMAAQDKGDLERAEALLRDLHLHHPGIFAVDESLGLLLAGRENYSAALPFLEAGVREQPASDAAHANLGAACFQLHRNQQALSQFQIAARINPQNLATQRSLGRLYMEAHQPPRAADAFAAALALQPGDSDLTLDLAQSLIETGNLAKAEETLRGMPGADSSASAQLLLGNIKEKSGAFVEAARAYQRAVTLDPSEPNLWELGVEFLRHWTFDAAIPEFQAGVERFPSSKRMKLGLGVAYFGDAKYSSAIPIFADLLDADRDSALYAQLLGMACTAVMQGDRPRCSSLIAYAQSHPGDAQAGVYAATGLLRGQFSEVQLALAEKLLRGAIAADPKLADARCQLGILEQDRSQWEASIPQLEAAIALKPDFAIAHYRLGIAYSHIGRRKEAQEQMVLNNKYRDEQAQDLGRRLHQITLFVVNGQN